MSELISEIRRATRISGLGKFHGDVKIEPARGIDDSPRLRLNDISAPKTKKMALFNKCLKEKFPGLRAGRTLGFNVVIFAEDGKSSENISEAFDRLYEEKNAEFKGDGKSPWYFKILQFVFGKDPLWHD